MSIVPGKVDPKLWLPKKVGKGEIMGLEIPEMMVPETKPGSENGIFEEW